jgi:ATP-dependent RNA helicase DeaD
VSLKFTDYALSPEILKALEEMDYKEASFIQQQAIPRVLENQDLIALAKTGSGKTAACAIPVCQKVDVSSLNIQALIIVPTRELALQYAQETQKIGCYKGVKAFALCGGEDYSLQQSKLKAGVQVLVATPGRLIDFVYSRSIDLSHVATLILDEADEMLSMGFIDDLEFIIQCLVQEHQTLLFSATMPKGIRHIAMNYLKNPQEIALAKDDERPVQIDHKFLFCNAKDREVKLLELIKQLQPKQAIVFCHSRIQTEQIGRFLKRHLDGVDMLHAGFGQDIRTIVTNKFRQQRVRILVATDVVARGLDFSSVSHVFIYELSHDPDTYIHRSGRTGRFDKEGVVVTLVTHRELHTTHRIEKKLGKEISWIGEPPPKERPHPPHPRSVRPGGGMRRRPSS